MPTTSTPTPEWATVMPRPSAAGPRPAASASGRQTQEAHAGRRARSSEPADHPDGERHAGRPGGRGCPASTQPRDTTTTATAKAASRPSTPGEIAALPGQHRADRHRTRNSGTISGTKVGVEVGRADRDLGAADRVQDQRVERAEQHGRSRGREQEVVEQQAALARDRRRTRRRPARRRAPGEERQRAADRDHEQRQDEDRRASDRSRRRAPRSARPSGPGRCRAATARRRGSPAGWSSSSGASRFSTTIAECSSAVAASQGMKEAFSTGSQNHQPPQPSS